MRVSTRLIAVAGLVIVLAAVNWSIATKERLLARGDIVYLRLAPVDPRSLMQGDYMALRFQVANEVSRALSADDDAAGRRETGASNGLVVVRLDERRIGELGRLYEGGALSGDELALQYRLRNGTVKFATNAFFFQEGHAQHYEPARYGQFRVGDDGELLLTGMYDEELNRLGPGYQEAGSEKAETAQDDR